MGIGFWLLIWLTMFLAFTTAWGFIVKGCEAMDVAEGATEEEAAH